MLKTDRQQTYYYSLTPSSEPNILDTWVLCISKRYSRCFKIKCLQKYVLRKNCTARRLFKSCWGIALFDLNFNSHVFEAKQYKVLYLVLHTQYIVLSLELFFWSGIIFVNWHSIISGNLVALFQHIYFY